MAQMITFKQLKKVIKGKGVFVKCGTVFIQVKPAAIRGLAAGNDLNELRFQVSLGADIHISEIYRYTPSINRSAFDIYEPQKFGGL